MSSLQKSIVSGDPAAASAFGSKLFSRHGPFPTWADVWWPVVVQSVQDASAEPKVQATVLDAAVAHINHVCDLAGSALSAIVGQWLDTLTPATRIELLSKRSSAVYRLFLTLITQRRLSTVVLMDSLVFPVWKHAALLCLAPRSRLPNAQQHAIESTVITAQQLLLTVPPQAHLPPTTLQESFIVQTARAEMLQNHRVLSLIRHLPFLVVLGAVKGVADRIKSEIAVLLQALAMTPEFKTAAFRHLNLLKDTFLSSEWSKPSLDPAVESGMVDTLKSIMSEGEARHLSRGTRLNETGSSGIKATLPALGSGTQFSAWRWTRVVLEMRVEFKRLAMRIENNEELAEARDTLRRLVQSSLDREMTPDETDLLCETFRGIEPVVMQEVSCHNAC
jgi:mediator of RNA polymerase II transcription subunit 12